MTRFVWPSIGLYCLMSVFVFYQQLHHKNFAGGSLGFSLALGMSAILGSLTGLFYLGYYGWNISWWAAVVVLALSVLTGFVSFAIERVSGAVAISLIGFVGWPICAYFMFKFLADGT
jgi:hypothetical protein